MSAYTTKNFTTYSDLVTEYGMAETMNTIRLADPFDFAENDEQWWTRVSHGFADIRDRHQDGDNVLIVSHGTTIRGIAEKLNRHDLASDAVKNGALMQIELLPNSANISRFNDDSTVFNGQYIKKLLH